MSDIYIKPYEILDQFSGIDPGAKLSKIMPSISEFAEHSDFCGKTIYPKQRVFLKLIFMEDYNFTEYDKHVIDDWIQQGIHFDDGEEVYLPDDVYQRIQLNHDEGRNHFREVIDVGGRRGGKGYIGGIMGSRKSYEMICLDDPQRYFGVDPDKDMYLNVVATSQSQASKYLFSDVQDTIQGCKALMPYINKSNSTELTMMTPADIRKLAEFKKHGIRLDGDMASIRVTANAASGSSLRGGAAFMQAFDEFAFQVDTGSNKSGAEIYDAATPSLKQTGKDALVYVPSSPFTKVGKFHELYVQAKEKDINGIPKYPEMLVLQHPSWSLYEDWEFAKDKNGNQVFDKAIIAYDKEMQQIEKRDPEKFKVEYRGRFANTMDAYLAPEMVNNCFANNLILKDRDDGILRYRFHADPAKSQDMFCYSGGYSKVESDGRTHVYIDFMRAYQATDFPINEDIGVPWIDYPKVVDDIITTSRLFNITNFSFDQFNAAQAIQQIQAAVRNGKTYNRQQKITQFTFSEKRNKEMFEVLKSAIYMGLVHIAPYYVDLNGVGMINLPEQELKFLQMKNGRVDHQSSGAITSKDCVDTIAVIVYDLLGEYIKTLNNDIMIVGAAQGGYNQTGRPGATSDIAQKNRARLNAFKPQRKTDTRGRGRGYR